MKIYLSGLLSRLMLITLSSICLVSAACAYENVHYLKAEVFTVPSYKSKVRSDSFDSIGIDGKTGNISLANDYGWCEIPYRNGKFDFKSSFIAPTKGYKLKAVASSPDGVYVFDVLSNSVMGDRGKYKVSVRINNPAGMAYHKDKIYVADKKAGSLYKLQLTDGQAKVLQIFKVRSGICGLASDGEFLYSCDSSSIYKYDSNINVAIVYKLNVSIAGITIPGPGEILAVAKNKSEIYKFRF